MEKLQAALEKARRQRRDGGSAAGLAGSPAAHGAFVGTSDRGIAEAWDALQPLDIDPARMRARRIVAHEAGPASTSFDVLRTRIQHLMQASGWRRLAITSPGAGCGKTTLSINLTASLGRQEDQRVILMDMDMRRPSLGDVLGLPTGAGHPGTADVLEGRVSFAEQARRLGGNVAISANSVPSRNSAELLHSNRTAAILAEIRTEYDPTLMLFDMPPLLVSDDTAGFLAQVDCALIVAEGNVSTISQIDRTERELSELTNVVGVVLNKSRFRDETYDSYGYGYKYGY